jgi:hypothetical protein
VRLAGQTALQDSDGAIEVSFRHAHVPEAHAPEDEAIARIAALGDPERLLAERQRLLEFSSLGQAQGQPGPGEDGWQRTQSTTFVQQVALEDLQVLA